MRWPDGYAGGDRAYLEAVAAPLDRSVRVTVQTVDYVHVADLPIDADAASQIDADADSEGAERKTTLTLFDDDGVLAGPSMHLQVQVVEELRAAGLPRPAVTPMFCGPIVRPPSRAGRVVTVECEDRGAIPLRGRAPKPYPAGNTVALIRQILADSGETRFRFPTSTARTEEPTTVGRADDVLPLRVARKLAATLDMHLYPDQEGWWVLRDFPSAAVDLTSLMKEAGDVAPPSEIVNHVIVKGKRATVTRTLADLDANHPMTPWNLRVNGVSQYFTVEEADDKLNTLAKVTTRANRLMKDYKAKLDETRRYTMIPFAGLDVHDRVLLDGAAVTARSFTLPVAGGDMTLGWTAPLPVGRRR